MSDNSSLSSLEAGLDDISFNDVTTTSSDVTADLDWVREDKEDIYAKGGLAMLEVDDGSGQCLRLREADGLLVSPNVTPDILSRVHTLTARPGDVLIATYPKSGTHWVWEIVSMLMKQSETLLPDTILHVDFFPMSLLEALPSPRVLATHMPFSRVPRDFLTSGCKMVWMVRSPWDVAVSYFHFIKKINVFDYQGDWNGFFELFLDGNVPYNSWFDHSLEWLKAMGNHSNIFMIKYEDLHKNFKKEVERLADFLQITVTEDMLDCIHRETAFCNMAANKTDVSLSISVDGTSPVFRKGRCGEWQEWFSEQQWAELRGAYRVGVGAYHRTLQYSNTHTLTDMH